MTQAIKIPVQGCPNCGHIADRASGLSGESPSEGDVSICLYCGAFLMFTSDLYQRMMDKDDLDRLEKKHPDAWAELMRFRDLIFKRLGGIQ